MSAPGKPPGRPRKGSLEFRGGTWRARLTVTIQGVSIRRWFDTGTDHKGVARRRVDDEQKRLAAEGAASVSDVAASVARAETLTEAFERVVKAQAADGLKTWKDRQSRLQRYVLPELQHLAPGAVSGKHIRSVLELAAETLSKQSVIHLRNDLSTVFGDLWRDELIKENPVQRVKLPKKLRVELRRRVQLTDPEFARFMACPDVPELLQLKALSSRSFGGQRTSDLHAWDWSHFDLETWITAKVYRPKTDGEEINITELVELVIPEPLRTQLHAYWTREGKPKTGPVFPVQKGERAGEKQGKRSHARELRAALWRAGVHRPLPGFEEALAALLVADERLAGLRESKARGDVRDAQRARRAALEAVQGFDAIQADCEETLCADFHSFRRAFNTALAAMGLNVQQAMALAGHKSAQTHMRYVNLLQGDPLEMPAGALPALGVLPTLWPKLADSVGASNHEALGFQGDSSENRTRVTGVRGQCPNR